MRLQALTKCAAVAGALALPFAATVPAASATGGGTGSAYAISASGPVAIPATPSVTSSAMKPERKSVAELPANPLVQARLLTAAAWSGHGRASVADLTLSKLGLTARAVTAKCENGNGVSHLVKAKLNGRTLKSAATPNTSVRADLKGLGNATVTLNRHVRDKDGNLTITAIQIRATLAGKTQTINIASVTCGKGGSHPGKPDVPPAQSPSPGAPQAPTTPTAPPSVAPVPTPVTGDLPVTG